MPGTLLIRADGGPTMGTGHVMRALAMAYAWRAAGGPVRFVTACSVEPLQQRIRAAGAELIVLDRSHPDPADLAITLPLLEEGIARDAPSERTWVMLDGYHLDTAYQQAIRAAGGRLLVIDDKAHLDHYHADVVLNQNVHAEEFDYACDAETVPLLGCRFALLRPEFRREEASCRAVPTIARRLLVTLGGADPDNATGTIVAGIARLRLPSLETRVVVGAAYRHIGALRGQVDGTPGHVEILSDVDNLPELMAWADVAVSAAGITCWELAHMQVPTLLVALIEAHEPVVRRMAEARFAASLGRADRLTPEVVAEVLERFCRNGALRAQLAAAGRRLVDGRGTDRVVGLIRALDGRIAPERLQLRPASLADARSLWRLANDPAVRRSRLGSDTPIPWTVHDRWLKRRLASPGSRLWVLELEGVVLAHVRYDKTDTDIAEVSILVAPAFRRRGLAADLLNRTWAAACGELDVRRVHAIVRPENVASARTFAKAGFARLEGRTLLGNPCHVFQRKRAETRPADRI